MPKRAKRNDIECTLPRIAIAVFLCVVIGSMGSIFTAPTVQTWYAELEKPSWTPPNGAFAPIWTTLFVLMGISLCMVWGKGSNKPHVKMAIQLFSVQLLLNVLWSFFFFGLRSPLYGMIEIIVLWAAIAITISEFYKISKPAAALLLPYIGWVTIAAALNYSVLVLNVA